MFINKAFALREKLVHSCSIMPKKTISQMPVRRCFIRSVAGQKNSWAGFWSWQAGVWRVNAEVKALKILVLELTRSVYEYRER